MTQYIAYYKLADPSYVLTADPKFPRRDTLAEAVQDVADAWHKGHPHGSPALHLVPYAIDDETVTALEVKVRRRTEVVEVTR